MDKDNILSEGFYTKILKAMLPKSIRKGLTKIKMDALNRQSDILQKNVKKYKKKSEESFEDFLKELEKQTGKKVSKAQARKNLEKLLEK